MPLKQLNQRAKNLLGERKRREAALLGAIAVAGIYAVRVGYEPRWQLAVEVLLAFCLLMTGVILQYRSKSKISASSAGGRKLLSSLVVAVLAIGVPVGTRSLLKMGGTAPAWEMVWLTSFGIGAISLALFAWREREIGLSVISSGFLVLFAAGSADTQVAVWLAIGWAMLCLWWLVANHWERLDQCMSDSVRRVPMLRLGTTVSGLLLAASTAFLAWGQFGGSTRLSWGFMPTSGGDRYSDGTSRSGVGDGEAIVAAQEHASSFGAVDSDIFLDSEQPSLFDIFDDSIGEPMRPKHFEKAVALQQREVIEPNSKPGESGRGGQSFSIARQKAKPPTRTESDETDVVMRWIGGSGAHLAMERFTVFDGIDWRPSQQGYQSSLLHQRLEDRDWFFINRDLATGLYRGTSQQAVKVMRLDSPRVPSPAGVTGVSIKDVDRADFFGLSSDGSLIMPGRKAIPRQTNIRLVSWGVDEGTVRAVEQFSHGSLESADVQVGDIQVDGQMSGVEAFERIAQELCGKRERNWETVEEVIRYLRTEYEFDRQADCGLDDPLLQFHSQRRGGDHLFASAASVMLRSLGFGTRLTTGFYANPKRHNAADGETKITAEDVHAWLEVHVASDLWLPVEPTPGFAEPRLNRSTLLKLAATFWRSVPFAGAGLVLGLVGWFGRAYWGEQLCLLAWYVSQLFSPRRRLRIWSKILDIRCWLARYPRPSGVAQRRWIKQMCQANADLALKVDRCYDELDAVVFGGRSLQKSHWRGIADELIWQLSVGFIVRSRK